MNARRSLSFFSSIENLPRIESRASDLNRCASGGQLKKKRDGELALWTVTRAHTYTYELGNEALVLGVSRVTPEQKRGTEVQDYGFRLYNKAAGRFLSIDPLTSSYPMLTPYQFASNSPIVNIDLDGLESHPSIFGPGADGRPRILSASDNTVVHSIYSAENPTVDLAAIEQSTYMPEPALHKIFSGLLAAVTAPLNAISNDHAAGNARRLGNEARANELTTLSNEQYIEAAVGSAVGWGVGKTLRLGSTPISAPVKASVELQSSALRMSDDIIEGAFNTTSGETLDFMGQALVTRNSTGTTLEITEGILYPNNIVGNALKNEIGPRAILQTKNEIVKFAKAEGHSELRLQFRRAPNSSSANPGKNTEFIIDLKK